MNKPIALSLLFAGSLALAADKKPAAAPPAMPQVKKGADEYTSTFEMQGPDGKWMKTGETTCKRAKK